MSIFVLYISISVSIEVSIYYSDLKIPLAFRMFRWVKRCKREVKGQVWEATLIIDEERWAKRLELYSLFKTGFLNLEKDINM